MTYAWTSIGGHLALDLCNTVSWRHDPGRRIDRLAGPAQLDDWFSFAAGRPPSPAADHTALLDARRLRDATGDAIDAHLDGRETDLRVVREYWLAALAAADVPAALPMAEAAGGRIVPVLALAVGELLHRADLSALRRCAGDGCGWLFLDTTRNHSRRWCDSQDCGNRARVRAYQRRRRA